MNNTCSRVSPIQDVKCGPGRTPRDAPLTVMVYENEEIKVFIKATGEDVTKYFNCKLNGDIVQLELIDGYDWEKWKALPEALKRLNR